MTIETEVPRKKWYKRRGFIAAVAVVGIPALAFGWWLFSPLLFDKEVIEEFPRAAVAQVPEGLTLAGVEEVLIEAEAKDATTMEDMPEAEPLKVLGGQLEGADAFHKGSGDVGAYVLDDGSQLLRFENLDVTNGPQLHVFLSPVAGVEGSDDVKAPGYVDLGGLKGNLGDQNYDIPADIDLSSGDWTVVIYCVPFNVVFATAGLTST